MKDDQGGIIPGATVTLVSETRGTSLESVTTTAGDFVFSNILGDTYMIRVSMDGFKTVERRGVSVSPGDRVVVGTLNLEVGTLAETVLVSGEAPMIQLQMGDWSYTVAQTQVENLPNAGRNFASFAALVPGVVATITPAGTNAAITRLGGGTTNFLLDGVSNVDPGGNGQGLQLNMDAIAEVGVLSSVYQAEYGRSSGLQISGVTKSGTTSSTAPSTTWNATPSGTPTPGQRRQRHCQARFETARLRLDVRRTDWQSGRPNSLFFFYAHQFSPRTTGGAVNLFRMPTALERQGDFSQSTDNTGAPFPYIRDAGTGLPCAAADTRGCFQDGGVLGRDSSEPLVPLGLNVLEDVSRGEYNRPELQPADRRAGKTSARPSSQWGALTTRRRKAADIGTACGPDCHFEARAGHDSGFNDNFQKLNSRYAPSATGVYTLNSSTILEATWGMNYINQLNPLFHNEVTNRCTVGLCDFPLFFPDAGIVPPDSWDYYIIEKTGSPFFVNGEVLMPPVFTWGSRVANAPPSLEYRNNIDYVRTHNMAGSVTKLAGNHTFKFGIQWDHSRKVQYFGAAGSIPFQGTINFGNDSNNPLDSGFRLRECSAGILSSYSQQAKFIEGNWVLRQHRRIRAGYLESEWEALARLRPAHYPPGAGSTTELQSSNFLPENGQRARRPCSITRVLGGHPAMPGRQPRGHRSENRSLARTKYGRAGRHHRPEHRRPDQRHLPGRPGDPPRRTTPGRRLRSRPVLVLPTT